MEVKLVKKQGTAFLVQYRGAEISRFRGLITDSRYDND
jgi:hypothetical protein